MITGIAAGIMGPVLGVYLFYLLQFSGSASFDQYIDHIATLRIMPKILVVSLLVNLLFFFIFIWLKIDRAARGVITATMFYGALIVVLKFLG